jgi:hypothetical protein
VFPEMHSLIALRRAGVEIWAVSSTNRWVVAKGCAISDSRRPCAGRGSSRRRGLITSELVDVPTDEGKAASLARIGLPNPDAVFGNSIHDLAMLKSPAIPSRSTHPRRCWKRRQSGAGAISCPRTPRGLKLRLAENRTAPAARSGIGTHLLIVPKCLNPFRAPLARVTLKVWKKPSRTNPRPAGPALRFVAAALIVRGGEVLIGQRRADQPMACSGSFPAAKSSRRKPEQALARELDEELGIKPPSAPASPASATTTATAAPSTCSSSPCTSFPAKS